MSTETVFYDPSYKAECDICGQSPTVVVKKNKNGQVVYRPDLCGPCYFGEAAMLDPAEWNK